STTAAQETLCQEELFPSAESVLFGIPCHETAQQYQAIQRCLVRWISCSTRKWLWNSSMRTHVLVTLHTPMHLLLRLQLKATGCGCRAVLSVNAARSGTLNTEEMANVTTPDVAATDH